MTYARSLSTYDVVGAEHVLFTSGALDVLEGQEPGGASARVAEVDHGSAPAPDGDGDDETEQDEEDDA